MVSLLSGLVSIRVNQWSGEEAGFLLSLKKADSSLRSE
jgi:hypothetical protein